MSGSSQTTVSSLFQSLGSRQSLFYTTCDVRPRPLSIFIVSGLTLTCGHWALSNGDMCIEKTEKWASNIDEMTERGKDDEKARWDVRTVAVLVNHRKQGPQ